MNNVILSLPSIQAAPAVNGRKGTTDGNNLFQSLFQQAAASLNNESPSNLNGSVSLLEGAQDKQDMQVVLDAFFNKTSSEETFNLEEQPEDAWELVEQVLGEDNLAAFLPVQLKEKAEEVLRNIKPSGQEGAVNDILAKLKQFRVQLTESNAAGNSNGIGALLQQSLPTKANSSALTTMTQAGLPSPKNRTENTGGPNNSVNDLAVDAAASSKSKKTDTLSLLQAAKSVSTTNAMDNRSVRGELQSQSKPKLTETANAIRQIVEASESKDETSQSSKNVTTQPKQDSQAFDAKQVSTLHVSKQEQLVFHLKQADQAPEQAGKELVQKIEQAVKFSGMLSDRNGLKELSIQLRPGNLGDLQVKLVRENGDITVQIVAASKQAKEMLDSNISSLKHMFSPHQVSITERVDQIQTAAPERNTQQQFQDNNEEQQKRQHSQQQEIQDSMDTSFAEILMEQEGIRV